MSDFIEIAMRLFIMAPQLAIVGFSIYLLIKRKSIESILLTIGSILTLAVWNMNIALPAYLYEKGLEDKMEMMAYFGYLGTLGSFVFAIGFILLVRKIAK